MASPFPGMDPYLEAPDVFPDFHNDFVCCLNEALQRQLPEPYYASTEARVWVESSERAIRPDVRLLRGTRERPASGGGTALASPPRAEPTSIHVPEDEITETSLQIYTERGNRRLVTSIEVLSPSNKRSGDFGRELYLRKQREVLQSEVNLVEIDLLRGGEPTTAIAVRGALGTAGELDYHVCVRRFHKLGDDEVYAILMTQPLPEIEIPLLPDSPGVRIDLQPLFGRCYEAGPYSRNVDYSGQPIPPLPANRMGWVRELLRNSG